jgi:hypothetical protein
VPKALSFGYFSLGKQRKVTRAAQPIGSFAVAVRWPAQQAPYGTSFGKPRGIARCDGCIAAIHGVTLQAPDRPARPSMAGRSAGHAAVPAATDALPPSMA